MIAMKQGLDGKTALVTGASSGIGRAIAHRLVAAGCQLVLSGRNKERLQALADELDGAAIVAPQDLSQPSEIASSLDLVQSKYGKLDILVLSAGLFSNNEFAEEDIEVSRRMIDVNLTSVVQLTHAALPLLKRQERSEILAIGSIAGVSDMRNEAVYSATKHALNAFLRSLRRQVAKDGVRVTSILPGTVATELWGLTDEADIAERVAKCEVLRAEDVADIAEFVLTQPPHVAIRELVVLPHAQDI